MRLSSDHSAAIEHARPVADALGEAAPGPEAGDDGRDLFTIRDLAREFEVSSRTLRFYEEKGLVNPRREGQDRLYSRRDRARLKYVMMGKCVGFSLDEIREMLDLYDVGDRQVTQLKVAQEKFGERIARLQRQRDEIDRAIAELAHARKLIDGMLATRERNTERA
jgi:DNA-binding transcriptional MerR regulator